MAKPKHLGLWITLGAILLVLVILVGTAIGSYNSMLTMQENVNEKQSAIEVQMQRRSDLIPNLVNAVKGYMTHEESVFTAIADARTKLSSAETVKEMDAANAQLSSSLDQLTSLIVEDYPYLESHETVVTLMDELSGAENRITIARINYNDAAKEYNTNIKKFPGNILAGMFGFEEVDYFEAESDASEVPEVSFE